MKCKIIKTIYRIEDEKTFCTIVFDIVSKKETIFEYHIETKGVSICNNTDKFDPKTGMRIALAKAERQMYKIAYKMAKAQLNDINNVVNEITDFLPFAKEQIEHDTKHILSICD